MSHELDFPDLAYWLDQPEPHEDADGFLIGWTGREPDAATWAPAQTGEP